MQIADRVSLWGGKKSPLPPGARWVEYLESTVTQYIDTGVDYFADFEIGIKLRASATNKALGVSGTMCMERYNASNPYWQLNINGVGYRSNAPIVDYHNMSWRGGVFAADGVTVRTVSNPFASGTMTLFGVGGRSYPNMIYACKLWDSNGVLVRNFRPIAIGTTGYLLDLVSGEYLPYGNAGTGELIVGPDAPAMTGGGYKRLCVKRSHRRSSRPSARFWRAARLPRTWKEVA